MILGRNGIHKAFSTGRGSIVIRAKHHIEQAKGTKASIIIDEIPYQVNKAKLVERINEVAKEKLVEGMSEVRDESNRDGIRVVIEVKRDSDPEIILNQLYAHTATNFICR